MRLKQIEDRIRGLSAELENAIGQAVNMHPEQRDRYYRDFILPRARQYKQLAGKPYIYPYSERRRDSD